MMQNLQNVELLSLEHISDKENPVKVFFSGYSRNKHKEFEYLFYFCGISKTFHLDSYLICAWYLVFS